MIQLLQGKKLVHWAGKLSLHYHLCSEQLAGYQLQTFSVILFFSTSTRKNSGIKAPEIRVLVKEDGLLTDDKTFFITQLYERTWKRLQKRKKSVKLLWQSRV